jgi:hypothetical protein
MTAARDGSEQLGGALVRTRGRDPRLHFVPANVVERIALLSAVTPVPGVRPPAVGIALADGEVVTVLELSFEVSLDPTGVAAVSEPRAAPPPAKGPAYRPGSDWPVPGADRALICEVGGQRVAITGGTLVATGVFDADPGSDGIVWRGEIVPALDVRALWGLAEAAIWAARSRGRSSLRPGPPRDPPPHEGGAAS